MQELVFEALATSNEAATSSSNAVNSNPGVAKSSYDEARRKIEKLSVKELKLLLHREEYDANNEVNFTEKQDLIEAALELLAVTKVGWGRHWQSTSLKIFLDVDGVLNKLGGFALTLHEDNCREFIAAVQKAEQVVLSDRNMGTNSCDDAVLNNIPQCQVQVVLSSSWRTRLIRKLKLQKYLERQFKVRPDFFCGETEEIAYDMRHLEIRNFAAENCLLEVLEGPRGREQATRTLRAATSRCGNSSCLTNNFIIVDDMEALRDSFDQSTLLLTDGNTGFTPADGERLVAMVREKVKHLKNNHRANKVTGNLDETRNPTRTASGESVGTGTATSAHDLTGAPRTQEVQEPKRQRL
ncbi:unnamed protein product [Amoebophrya sp. A120]|nr:unnamed protein product [Amoebophrya sp. A120]|eukprot:GSA120T00020792001.1